MNSDSRRAPAGAPQLSIRNHDRDLAGLTYIYAVLSRRAGGVSIGVNLNPNNACNWHCAYCQVPNLVRGKAPAIDLARLEAELAGFLDDLAHGDWLDCFAPADARTLRDIAFSGNGESTSAKEFEQAVVIVARQRDRYCAAVGRDPATLPLRLITNGSLLGQDAVQRGVRRLAEAGGEVWFKVDAGTPAAIARINGVDLEPAAIARNLATCAALCPTWVQTCMLRWDGHGPADDELAAYLALLRSAGLERIRGVLLYGLARPSRQPEAAHLSALPTAELEAIGARLRRAGLTVSVSP